MSIACPSCGHADDRATRFCTRCGVALDAATAAAAAAAGQGGAAADAPAAALPPLRPPRRTGGLPSLVAMFAGLAAVSGVLTYWVLAGS